MTQASKSTEEAITFFRAHSKWLADNWNMTPEGRAYKAEFDRHIDVLTSAGLPALPVKQRCSSRDLNGVCQAHNLQCGFPHCERIGL